MTLNADAGIGTFGPDGEGGRIDIGAGYGRLDGGGFRLVKLGQGRLSIRVTNTVNLAELVVSNGLAYAENANGAHHVRGRVLSDRRASRRATINAGSFFVGEQDSQTGIVSHVNATAVVTNQARLGHWPTEVSAYTMDGGSFTVTAGGAYRELYSLPA